jgi:NADPH:quinone reductase-like Zn-dependent oxidoreductase
MPLMLEDVTIQGIGTGHRRALENLVRAVDRAGLNPVVDSRFRFAELPAAFDRLDDGPFGKVVLEL